VTTQRSIRQTRFSEPVIISPFNSSDDVAGLSDTLKIRLES
jgi:hypothetical protein